MNPAYSERPAAATRVAASSSNVAHLLNILNLLDNYITWNRLPSTECMAWESANGQSKFQLAFENMISSLISLLVPVALVAGLIILVVRRGLQMRLLAMDGVETTGQVVAKLRHIHARRKGSQRPSLRIHYAYRDAAGGEHEHRSLVTDSFWNEHVESGPIAIVYSKSRPHISAPKHLVELSREALAKRGAIRSESKG